MLNLCVDSLGIARPIESQWAWSLPILLGRLS